MYILQFEVAKYKHVPGKTTEAVSQVESVQPRAATHGQEYPTGLQAPSQYWLYCSMVVHKN